MGHLKWVIEGLTLTGISFGSSFDDHCNFGPSLTFCLTGIAGIKFGMTTYILLKKTRSSPGLASLQHLLKSVPLLLTVSFLLQQCEGIKKYFMICTHYVLCYAIKYTSKYLICSLLCLTVVSPVTSSSLASNSIIYELSPSSISESDTNIDSTYL